MTDELPPRQRDRLFRVDVQDSDSEANLTHSGSDRYAYSEGYRRGAQLLIKYVTDTTLDKHILVYPIIFLYRHHIELVLKDILLRSVHLTGFALTEAAEKHFSSSHGLDLLWLDVQPVLANIHVALRWSPPDPDEIAGVTDYIQQLSAVDPDSCRFRYTRSKHSRKDPQKDEPSLPSSLTHINLRLFGE